MNNTNLGAIIVAVVAGALGAGLWAVVSLVTGYEVGYVAWAIGGLVGFAAVLLGGRGSQMGIVCGVIALASIFCGKVISTHFVVDKEIKAYEANFTKELYKEIKKDAAAFAKLPADAPVEDVKQYMFDRKYTEAQSPEDITEENLKAFLEYEIPHLKAFKENPPPYSQWKEESFKEFKNSFYANFSLVSAATEDLNFFDIIFAFLGVSTAYGLVNRVGSRRREEGPGPEPA